MATGAGPEREKNRKQTWQARTTTHLLSQRRLGDPRANPIKSVPPTMEEKTLGTFRGLATGTNEDCTFLGKRKSMHTHLAKNGSKP